MGRLQAEAMMEASITLEQQIEWHLTTNHYPPVPKVMVKTCIEAIDMANEGKWWDKVKLPENVRWKDYTSAPVCVIIEAHHLEPWIIESELD